jgi:hypothetical protein
MGEPTIRPFRPGDEAAINDGFNAVFGLSRPLEEWAWKFPAGADRRWIMVAVDEQRKVLAHYGAIPSRLRIGDTVVRGGQIVDAYSRIEVRGQRVFTDTYLRFVAEFCHPEGIAFGFGFPGRRHYEMGLRALGYELVGPAPYWRRGAAGRTGWPWQRRRVRTGWDQEAYGRLWAEAAGRYPCGALRDARWMARRFTGRPAFEYLHLAVWRGDRPAAWAVARPERGVLRCGDLVWDGADPAALEEMSQALVRAARRLGCADLDMWLGGDPAAESRLAELGWRREESPDDLLFVARSFHPAVDLERIRRSMYLTFGDSDLV